MNNATDNAIRGQRPIYLNLQVTNDDNKDIVQFEDEKKCMMKEIKTRKQLPNEDKIKKFRSYIMFRMLPVKMEYKEDHED